MLYGISELPEIIDEENGKPAFRDEHLPRFSISYAGNIVGVALTTEGDCGLDMELPHASRALHASHDTERYVFNSMSEYGLAISTILTKRARSLMRYAKA